MNTSLIVIILFAVALGLFYLSKKQAGQPALNAGELKDKMADDPGIIIDVRTGREHAGGHLKKTKHNFDVMSGEFEQQLDRLDKDQTYYLYCRSGSRSGKAANIMKRNEFENVYNIGGFRDLVNAGFEAEK